jgi:hypothetical protein
MSKAQKGNKEKKKPKADKNQPKTHVSAYKAAQGQGAVLLTNSQWPQPHGFEAADRWPKFAALLASRYVLDRSKNENGIAWRLYVRRTPPA